MKKRLFTEVDLHKKELGMSCLDELVRLISIKAKNRGYKKAGLTWYKDKDDLTVVLSIQKSRFDPETWFYNYGICLHGISSGKHHTSSACQIRYTVDCTPDGVALNPDDIVSLLEKWEAMYGNLNLLRIRAVQGKLPIQSTLEAIRYLTTVDISKIE